MTKANGKMTLTFDQAIYRDLLTRFTPKVIETEEEYDRILSQVEQLTFNRNRTPEERAIYKLLVQLIEAYEEQHYCMAPPSPWEILKHVMESSGTRQADLVGVIGTQEVVSALVSGQRLISKAQALALGDHFKVSPSLFMTSDLAKPETPGNL
jgi:HTH-type transcriptional regulator / antitoxin HigA